MLQKYIIFLIFLCIGWVFHVLSSDAHISPPGSPFLLKPSSRLPSSHQFLDIFSRDSSRSSVSCQLTSTRLSSILIVTNVRHRTVGLFYLSANTYTISDTIIYYSWIQTNRFIWILSPSQFVYSISRKEFAPRICWKCGQLENQILPMRRIRNKEK